MGQGRSVFLSIFDSVRQVSSAKKIPLVREIKHLSFITQRRISLSKVVLSKQFSYLFGKSIQHDSDKDFKLCGDEIIGLNITVAIIIKQKSCAIIKR